MLRLFISMVLAFPCTLVSTGGLLTLLWGTELWRQGGGIIVLAVWGSYTLLWWSMFKAWQRAR